MTTYPPTLCRACHWNDAEHPTRCAAYPTGIPDDIAAGGASHQAVRGDEHDGRTFLIRSGPQAEEAFGWWQSTYAGDAARARDTSQGATYTAPASSQPKGGQFALGGGRVSASGRKTTPRRPSRGPSKPSAPAGPLSFDGKRGTGYGIKGGDPRVRTLQSALNRLGLTDSSGAALVLDGKYGPRTTSSVKKLQKALGLTADGKVTPELLKQVSELKQLPPKKSTTPKAPVKRSASPHRHVLDNGICVTCNPDVLDEASQALLDAITEIADRH